jgi:hypothetical protein
MTTTEQQKQAMKRLLASVLRDIDAGTITQKQHVAISLLDIATYGGVWGYMAEKAAKTD